MTNPFDNLRKRSDEAHEKAQKDAEEKARKIKEMEAFKTNAFEQLSPMVMKVLEQLKQAIYPGYHVVKGINSWSVEVFISGVAYDDSGHIETPICVILNFDKQWKQNLLCRSGSGRQQVELNSRANENDLISTLQKLHHVNSSWL